MSSQVPFSARNKRIFANSRHRSRWAFALFVLAACRSNEPAAPAELRVPPMAVTVEHYAGSLLGGVAPVGTALGIDTAAEHALVVHFDLLYVERMPDGELAPVASRARVVAGMRGDEPILASSDLATEARVASGAAAAAILERIERAEFGRSKSVATQTGALPEAVVSTLSLTSSEMLDSPEQGPVQKRVEIQVARGRGPSAGDVTVALVLEDLAPEKDSHGKDSPSAATADTTTVPRKVLRRESIVLEDRPALGGEPLVLVSPSPFAGGEGAAFVARIAVENAPVDVAALAQHAALVAECKRQIDAAESRSAERAQFVGASEAQRRRLAGALARLKSSDDRRAALVLLGDATGAELCADLALAADDALLDALVANLANDKVDDELARGPSALGWKLERATLVLCLARRTEGALPADLAGLLARHTGEVGRSSGGLEDLLATSKDLDGLHERIVAENRIYLEDSNLAARVRAFDWLAAHELAPRGYDPFASLAERRAALDAAESDAAQRPPR